MVKRKPKSSIIVPLIRVCIARPPNENGDIFLDLLEEISIFRNVEISLIERPRDIPVSGGDKLLCELTRNGNSNFDARLVQKINEEKIKKIIGSFRSSASGGVVELLEKSSHKSWSITEDNLNGASDEDLVEIEQIKPRTRFGLPEAKVLSILGNLSDKNISSLIAINEYNIAEEFSNEALIEANKYDPINIGDRKDLRDIAFVTIDPEDAKDHDDACYVEPDPDKKNAGGFIIWIAIADVSYYVKKGTALDREALKRGNSTYFPDRVVPMLPDKLSEDLCSIHEGEDRPCLALKMTI
ncbi:MAG: RNB domain-containing ribonuclease, partial [Paracoccaceae bacterium]